MSTERIGVWQTPTHKCWWSMIQRCRTPSMAIYRHYGGRGIRVCDRWKIFANFLADMGERPPGKSLDRIDNDGNYEPGNCRWATNAEQSRNRSDTTRLTAFGETMCLKDWADRFGMAPAMLRFRLGRGIALEAALVAPHQRGRSLTLSEYCPHGHLMAGDNLFLSRQNRRFCRACKKTHRIRIAWEKREKRMAG